MVQLIPSVLSENLVDYKNLIDEFSKFSNVIHLDLMDGKYVENKSPDVREILAAVPEPKVIFNLHAMYSDPNEVLNNLEEFQNDIGIVYLHVDTVNEEILTKVYPFKLALVFNPDQEIEIFKNLIKYVDKIMIMTVMPGSQGSEFHHEALEKINELRNLGFSGEIHINGHVNEETIPQLLKFKPDVLNLGSVLNVENPEEEFDRLQKLV